jgi:Rad3-related DNA helicase
MDTQNQKNPGLQEAGRRGAESTRERYGESFLQAIIATKSGGRYEPSPDDEYSDPEPDEIADVYAEVFDAEPTPPPGIPPMADVLGPDGVIARRLPGYEHRPQQVEAAEAVREALLTERHAIVEAGTGVGKSLAYLIPAIYSRQKTLVATSGKALQDQLSQKDLPFLQSVLPITFSFATLKGRANYVCRRRVEDEASKNALLGASEEFEMFERWLGETETGDLEGLAVALSPELRQAVASDADECLGEDCPLRGSCFFRGAKLRAEQARIVVVNHTLLALDCALRQNTEDGAAVLPDREYVVVDEAHALEDTFTRAFEVEVSSASVESLLRDRTLRLAALIGAGKTGQAEQVVGDLVSQAAADSTALFDHVAPQNDWTSAARLTLPAPNRVVDLARNLGVRLETLAGYVGQGNNHPTKSPEWKNVEALRKRIEKVADTLGSILVPDEGDVLYVEQRKTRSDRRIVSLKRCPVDVGPRIAESLFDRWPTVCTSATITANNGFAYFKSRVGLDSAIELRVGSPFDYPSHSLLYLPPKGALFDPSAQRGDGSVEYFDRLGAEIEQLLLASDGRAFCLFTSNKALREVYDRIAHRLRWNVLRQGDVPRAELVRRFREDGHAVAFLTRSFFEGISVEGDALSLVVIDKLPFPSPDEPVYAARCEAINRKLGSEWAWFRELALPMATITTKQAFGRLIRTKADTGVVALLDGRLSLKNYGPGIIRALPPATMARHLSQVATFFKTRETPYRQEGML